MILANAAVALVIAAGPPADAAGEGAPSPALKLRPKAAFALAPGPHAAAPFVSPPAAERELDLLPRPDPRAESGHWSCKSAHALCYDAESGRIVYKPARTLMPDIPGLQRENISVRRDRIVLRYSF